MAKEMRQNPSPVFIHRSNKTRIETINKPLLFHLQLEFLYIDPIKQGLKLIDYLQLIKSNNVFIHRSNKTRIETRYHRVRCSNRSRFLYIDPIKQGLKLGFYPSISILQLPVFIHRSNKTRIETS